MSKKATIIAVVNQKGGTGKTTTTENLGVGLALEGKKVLLVDTDPQASLTVSLGNPCPDDLSPTLSDLMGKIMMENPITPDEGILHHPEGECTLDAMCEIMNEIKKGELDRVTFKTDSLRKYFPKSYTNKQMEDKIIQLLEQWQKKREKSMER